MTKKKKCPIYEACPFGEVITNMNISMAVMRADINWIKRILFIILTWLVTSSLAIIWKLFF